MNWLMRIIYTVNAMRLVGVTAWRTSATDKQAALTYACFKNSSGVPRLCIVIAEGREAWRVSTFACEALGQQRDLHAEEVTI